MFKSKSNPVNVWMSFSDLLTGALVVFMLITVVLVIKTKAEVTKIAEKEKEVSNIFITNLSGIEGVTVTKDGTIRFYSQNNSKEGQLFEYGKFELTSAFKSGLDSIAPKFLDALEKVYYESEKSGIEIKEIRIEGHTDSDGNDDLNLRLSQERATQTWFEIRDKILSKRDREFQEYCKTKIVTVGYGETKLLDDKGFLVQNSKAKENSTLSRRVELSVLFKGFGKE
jgi:outer membrane protein OmpA-like peptidoglycan-associated protein